MKYSSAHTRNYSVLVNDPNTHTVIVGARDHLIRLNIDTLEEIESINLVSDPKIHKDCMMTHHQDSKQEECANYIRIMHQYNNKLFVCGTNSLDPTCSWHQFNNLRSILETMDGKGRAPFASFVPSVSLIDPITANYYVGTWLDLSGKDAVFYRSLGPDPFLRTMQYAYNKDWLKRPEFIAIFNIGDFVYTFFKEVAKEAQDFKNMVYSRVSRVCKNDKGGTLMYDNVWITFRKARITCPITIKTDDDLLFQTHTLDSIIDVHFDVENSIFVALFEDPTSKVSAICAYNMTTMNEVFSGPYTYQMVSAEPNPSSRGNVDKKQDYYWITKPNPYSHPSHDLCKVRLLAFNDTTELEKLVSQASYYQTMKRVILPTSLVYSSSTQGSDTTFSHMLVHSVNTDSQNQSYLIYLISGNGLMYKLLYGFDNIMVGSRRDQACILEIMRLHESPKGRKINRMMGLDQKGNNNGKFGENHTPKNRIKDLYFSYDEKFIFILSDTSVLKLTLSKCDRNSHSKFLCTTSGDPLCGWDTLMNECVPRPSSLSFNANSQYWEPNIATCQTLNHAYPNYDGNKLERRGYNGAQMSGRSYMRDGYNTLEMKNEHSSKSENLRREDDHYTDWSDWRECDKLVSLSGEPIPGSCQCRERYCEYEPIFSSPRSNNMDDCSRPQIQISNCTVNGEWTEWSAWSACTHTCGLAMRYRYRSCSNPRPQFGGNDCMGNKKDHQVCISNPPCPEMKPESINGDWSEWTEWRPECNTNCIQKSFDSIVLYQNRSRHCNNPAPQNDGKHCPGNDFEIRSCPLNDFGCPNLIKYSNWTDWYIINFTNPNLLKNFNENSQGKNDLKHFENSPVTHNSVGYYTQTRLKFGCQADAFNSLPNPLLKSESRICSLNAGTQCTLLKSDIVPTSHSLPAISYPDSDPSNYDKGWGPWSTWATCDSDKNEQTRFRVCNTRRPKSDECLGINVARRACSPLQTNRESKNIQSSQNYIHEEDLVDDNSVLARFVSWKKSRTDSRDISDRKTEISSEISNTLANEFLLSDHQTQMVKQKNNYKLVISCLGSFTAGFLVAGFLLYVWIRRRKLTQGSSKLKSSLLSSSSSNDKNGGDFIINGTNQSSIDGSLGYRFDKEYRYCEGSGLDDITKANGSLAHDMKQHDISKRSNHYYQIPTPAQRLLNHGNLNNNQNDILLLSNHEEATLNAQGLLMFSPIKPTIANILRNDLYDLNKNGNNKYDYFNRDTLLKLSNLSNSDGRRFYTPNDSKIADHLLNNAPNNGNLTIRTNNCLENNTYYQRRILNGKDKNRITRSKSNRVANDVNRDQNVNSTNTLRYNNNESNLNNSHKSSKNSYASLPRLKKEASFKDCTNNNRGRQQLFHPHVYDEPF
ncbi:unnamed protein product [Gordionus sp. m RMFG-2023]